MNNELSKSTETIENSVDLSSGAFEAEADTTQVVPESQEAAVPSAAPAAVGKIVKLTAKLNAVIIDENGDKVTVPLKSILDDSETLVLNRQLIVKIFGVKYTQDEICKLMNGFAARFELLNKATGNCTMQHKGYQEIDFILNNILKSEFADAAIIIGTTEESLLNGYEIIN